MSGSSEREAMWQRVIQIPTRALFKRYLKATKADKGRATQVLHEYKRLLTLKALELDVDGTRVAGSPSLTAMWQQHVLDTAAYAHCCTALCGSLLHHSPDAPDEKEHGARCHRALQLYRRHFGEDPPTHTWDFGDIGPYATQGSNPSLADRVPHAVWSATHTFEPRLGQAVLPGGRRRRAARQAGARGGAEQHDPRERAGALSYRATALCPWHSIAEREASTTLSRSPPLALAHLLREDGASSCASPPSSCSQPAFTCPGLSRRSHLNFPLPGARAAAVSDHGARLGHRPLIVQSLCRGVRRVAPCRRPLCRAAHDQVAGCVDTHVPGPPHCTYGLRVPASCVLYVLAA